MTTGTKTLLPFASVTLLGLPYTYGTEITKTWSGDDAVTTLKPRPTYPLASLPILRSPSREVPVYRMRMRNGRLSYIQVGTRVLLGKKIGRSAPDRSLIYNFDKKRFQFIRTENISVARDSWLVSLRKKRALPPNNYTMTKTTIHRSVWAVKQGGYMNLVPPGSTAWPTRNFDVSKDYKLIDRIHSQFYGSGFNPGIFIGEGPKALQMIADSTIRMGAAIHRFKNGDWRGMFEAFGVEPHPVHRKLLRISDGKSGFVADYQFRDATKKISGLWLELSYGWKPLLSDMQDGAAWLAYAVNPIEAHSGRASARTRWTEHDYVEAPNDGNLCFRERTRTYRLQYVITGVTTKPPTSTPSLPSLAAVAWELTPYSFVVDWASPIGSYLQALRTSSSIKGTVVRTLLTETIYSNLSPGGVGSSRYNPLYRVAGVDDRHTIFSLSRSVTSEIVVPSPLTGFTDGHALFNDWRRAANAVALLVAGDFRSLSRGFSTSGRSS